MPSNLDKRRWLNKLSTIKQGSTVLITYQGAKYQGTVDAVIIKDVQFVVRHPNGSKWSVWREEIEKKIDRVVWGGLSENLYQLALDEGKQAGLTACEDLQSSLETVLECGTTSQKGNAAQIMRAVVFAASEITRRIK